MLFPTRSTFTSALPVVTTEPLNVRFCDERSRPPPALTLFVTSALSPLRADWSTVTVPEIIFPSACTVSPAEMSIISPTTSSSARISVICPFLITLATALRLSSSIFSKARSLPYSESVETVVDIRIAASIPNTSNKLQFPKVNTTSTASAITKTFIIGSERFSKNLLRILFFLALSSELSPYFSREAITSSSVSPLRFSFISSPFPPRRAIRNSYKIYATDADKMKSREIFSRLFSNTSFLLINSPLVPREAV